MATRAPLSTLESATTTPATGTRAAERPAASVAASVELCTRACWGSDGWSVGLVALKVCCWCGWSVSVRRELGLMMTVSVVSLEL